MQTALLVATVPLGITGAAAQAAASAPLPPVTVDAPKEPTRRPAIRATRPTRVTTAAPQKRKRTRTAERPSPASSPRGPAGPDAPIRSVDPALGPVEGLVPRQSATGTKTTTPLIETPQSIAVVGQEQIRSLNERTVDDALDYVSGVRSAVFGNDNRNDWFSIRGFPAQVDGYFLDGLQLPSPGFGTFKLEPFGLERLEVLKGPASVLYGGSNTGGIVNGVSKRPILDGITHGYLETGIDNYGNGYGAFDISGPVSKEPGNQFFYRMVGLARGGDTEVKFTENDRLYIAPSLTWAPDKMTTVTLLGSYQKDRTEGENFLPYVGTVVPAPFGKIPTNLFTSDPGLDTFQRNQAFIGYAAEHRFNDAIAIRQNLRYSDLRITDRTLFGGGYDGAPAAAELTRFNFVAAPHVQEFSVDTSVEAKVQTGPLEHKFVVGVDYKHYTDFDSQGFTFGADLNLLNPQYFTGATAPTTPFSVFRNTQDQLGEYIQDQIKFGRFTLVLSGRHDGLSSTFDNQLTPALSSGSNTDAFTGRAGLIYTSDIGLAPYVTAATSFDPQLGLNSATNQGLVPMTGLLEEIGIKYQPVGHKISFDAALFNLTQNNVLTTDPNNVMDTIQTGQERSRGFELSATGTITDGLTVLASYTGYQLRDTRDLNAANVGKVPANIPQNFGALLLDYTVQNGPLRGFGGGAGPRYAGASYAAGDDSAGVPSYVLADATMHYDYGHWRAAINVRNLFDKTYVASCSSITACFYGQRRTALFSLAYKW